MRLRLIVLSCIKHVINNEWIIRPLIYLTREKEFLKKLPLHGQYQIQFEEKWEKRLEIISVLGEYMNILKLETLTFMRDSKFYSEILYFSF